MAQDAGPSYTLDMGQVIAETTARVGGGGGGGGGGSESSGPSDITLDMDQVINETGTAAAGGGSESSGTGAQANTRIVIPKVRKQLNVIDENSYTPHYVPIGPYHSVKYSSSEIAEEKLQSVQYLETMLSEQQQEGGGLTDLAEELERLVRACYPRIGHMTTTEQWSTMLLHDGCYLLGCMVGYKDTPQGMPASSNNVVVSAPAVIDPNSSRIKWDWIRSCFSTNVNNTGGTSDRGTPASSNNVTASTPTGSDDQETSGDNNGDGAPHGTPASASTQTANARIISSCEDNMVVRDTVFLIDNQIPFFVLQRIHERVTGDTTSSVLEPIAEYVQEQLQEQLYISKHKRPAPPLTPTTPHLLHLVHFYLQPASSPQAAMGRNADDARRRTGRWRRATEYSKYGNVSFKPRVFKDDVEWTFLDVRLQGGTLWIPRLQVDNMTWTVLRNLMALEEGTPGKYVTAYCVFMSQVACNVEDVELLQRQGILEQFLVNNEEVAQGFANLCRGVVLDIDKDDRNYLKPIWHELRSLCTYPRYCCGSFRQKKCSDPIYIAAFVVAILVFIFQLAQVILPIPKVQKHLR